MKKELNLYAEAKEWNVFKGYGLDAVIGKSVMKEHDEKDVC